MDIAKGIAIGIIGTIALIATAAYMGKSVTESMVNDCAKIGHSRIGDTLIKCEVIGK